MLEKLSFAYISVTQLKVAGAAVRAHRLVKSDVLTALSRAIDIH